MKKGPFKLRSQGSSFKEIGSSPLQSHHTSEARIAKKGLDLLGAGVDKFTSTVSDLVPNVVKEKFSEYQDIYEKYEEEGYPVPDLGEGYRAFPYMEENGKIRIEVRDKDGNVDWARTKLAQNYSEGGITKKFADFFQ